MAHYNIIIITWYWKVSLEFPHDKVYFCLLNTTIEFHHSGLATIQGNYIAGIRELSHIYHDKFIVFYLCIIYYRSCSSIILFPYFSYDFMCAHINFLKTFIDMFILFFFYFYHKRGSSYNNIQKKYFNIGWFLFKHPHTKKMITINLKHITFKTKNMFSSQSE